MTSFLYSLLPDLSAVMELIHSVHSSVQAITVSTLQENCTYLVTERSYSAEPLQ